MPPGTDRGTNHATGKHDALLVPRPSTGGETIRNVVQTIRVAETQGFELAPVIVGGGLHLVTSMVLGLNFGIVFNRVFHVTTDFGTPLLLGLCYGLLIFVLAYAVILPMITPMLGSSWVVPLVAQNMVFGICLGGFYTMLRPRPCMIWGSACSAHWA